MLITWINRSYKLDWSIGHSGVDTVFWIVWDYFEFFWIILNWRQFTVIASASLFETAVRYVLSFVLPRRITRSEVIRNTHTIKENKSDDWYCNYTERRWCSKTKQRIKSKNRLSLFTKNVQSGMLHKDLKQCRPQIMTMRWIKYVSAYGKLLHLAIQGYWNLSLWFPDVVEKYLKFQKIVLCTKSPC